MFSRGYLVGLVLWLSMAMLACQSPLSRAVSDNAATSHPIDSTAQLASTPATLASASPSPAPPPLMEGSAAVLADTLSRLDTAGGYRYNITATLSYSVEDKLVEWKYAGQGATAPPDRYEWNIEGPADQRWHVVGVGGQTACSDAGGTQTAECGLAWGGPSPGASPYTAIAYLRFSEETGELKFISLASRDYYNFTFSPSLIKLSGLDDSHQQAIRQVTKASGEAWVDRTTGALRRFQVAILSVTPSGREQQTVLALTFFDQGEPVEIVLPVTGG